MSLSYNSLQPGTKKAIQSIANMYWTDFGKWNKYFNTISSSAHDVATGRVVNRDPNFRIPTEYWIECIQKFGLLTPEIRTELMPAPAITSLPTTTTINTLYPHKCKRCGSPSRRGNGMIICSKSQCKSMKAVRALLRPGRVEQKLNHWTITGSEENPIVFFCACGKKAGRNLMANTAYPGTGSIECECGSMLDIKLEVGKWYYYIGMNDVARRNKYVGADNVWWSSI
jgi:hypothetical protein